MLHVQLSDHAQMPQRMSQGAAGYDIYSAENETIVPYDRKLIGTGVRMAIPTGYYGQLQSRSSWAMCGIDVCAGVIDSDYRGEIKVLLANFSNETVTIHVGDRIAQLVILETYAWPLQLTDQLNVTARNEGGFGSTNTN